VAGTRQAVRQRVLTVTRTGLSIDLRLSISIISRE
jgi:hypothetical protein